MASKWIQGAIQHPGAFSAKAKKAGMSTSAYAHAVLSNSKSSPHLRKQAQLALTLMGMHKKKS